MKEKKVELYEKPLLCWIQSLAAIAYAVWTVLKIWDARYEVTYKELNLIEPILMTFFVWLVIKTYVKHNERRIYKIFAVIYTVLISIDACMNDSIMGVVFIAILLLELIKNEKGKTLTIVELFLLSVVVDEGISVFMLGGLIDVDSVMLQQIGGIWIDIILVINVIIYECIKEDKKIKRIGLRQIVSLVVIVFDISCVIVLSIGLYARMNSYYVTADQVQDGTSVYIINANKKDEALTCRENKLLMEKATNNENQEFTFHTSEQQGYWNIETNNENVFDVSNVEFREGNDVIVWEKNEVCGQDWTLRDVGSEQVEFISFDPGYGLTWGKDEASKKSAVNSACITSNQEDNHRHFLMKNAKTLKIPGVGWIINGNRFIIIAEYLIIMVLLSVVTGVNIIKRHKENKSEATEEDI